MAIKIMPLPDNRVAVTSPYNAAFVADARASGGRWAADRKAWVFPAETISRVRELLREHYGEDDTAEAPRVRLRVTCPLTADMEPMARYPAQEAWRRVRGSDRLQVVVGGRDIARAFDRDGGARIGADIAVLAGGFTSGGSRKNPAVVTLDGTVFDILRLAEPIARKLAADHPDICRVVTDDGAELDEQPAANVVPLKREAK